METFTGLSPRNNRGERRANLGAVLSLIQDERSAAEFTAGTLQSAYGALKSTTKLIARAANRNDRSAENWLQGRVCPNVPSFLRLAMQTPELNAAIIWLMQNGSAHPESTKRVAAMKRYMASLPEEGDRV